MTIELKLNLNLRQQQFLLHYFRQRYKSKFGSHAKKLETYVEMYLIEFLAAESKKESDAAMERMSGKDYWNELPEIEN